MVPSAGVAGSDTMALSAKNIGDEGGLMDDQVTEPAGDETLVADDLLVEEVSIDGMCGVY